MPRPRAISPLHRQQLFLESGLPHWMAAWRVESPSVIIATTACYLATGVFAFLVWQLTGNVEWVVEFFQVPAALLMLWLALLQFSLSLNATRNFSSDDFLRPAWMLIACSAGCQLVGSFLTQVLGRIPG
jgi:hypothetical protein